ncbi:acyl-CoA dehydrogenase family protein [Mycobacterium sp. CVI_P3]|uniref:Acyl-CoA dehydrogenase family protein n=1 Tax=Mycobacterium pinniadriaticum TaxID=2994102 RepID=A0ABT3SNV7_9MYCO|nr:acyl-CoA dehydrogenase family protein [Mycobacterium pinniadriaticum]MCX2934435.1 acyl-CoA dehydrogenase family protein [Mycobacterium pinniadriaticum]MCX2940858.1 acyl-CoA dehydrogenase family protein [Mycobacterium pinniadriaticum]
MATEVGFEDVLVEDSAVAAVFFEEFGRIGLANRLADLVVAHTLAIAGSDAPSMSYPIPGGEVPSLRADGGLDVDLMARCGGRGERAGTLLVLCGEDVVLIPTAGLERSSAPGFDIAGDWIRLRGNVSLQDSDIRVRNGATFARPVVRAALASELCGIAQKINELAVEHVTSRHQFGKALGSFQSVRHRLAETHVAIQAARPVIESVWLCVASTARQDDMAALAMAAKALAGRAFEIASASANQVCGGMGLSWEHPLHTWVRRGSALNALYGRPNELSADLGRALARGCTLPAPDPLVDDDCQSPPK